MKNNYNLKGLRGLLKRDVLKAQGCIRYLQLMLIAALTTITISANAQNTRTGTVTDSKTKEPVIGANVKVKGTSNGVSTNADGKFSINAPAASVLVISGIGYASEQITVGSSSTINVSLNPSDIALSEVVVVGYGTQKRTTLTGAISSVNSKMLNEVSVPSIEQALQGRVPGLSVTNNGSPGTAPIVAIRGISSINFSSGPLYVIDGIPTSNSPILDSKDVEGVEVLKDASASAIYGSRATGGVILITTKKGKRDSPIQVSADTYAGVQGVTKKLDLLNTAQYLQYERALNGAAGIAPAPRFSQAEFNKPIYEGTTQTYAQTNTDWQDAYFKKNQLQTGSSLSISGGNAASRFYSSAGYYKQNGIAQALSYERGNFRINSDHIVSKHITFGQNLYVGVGDQRFDATGGNRTPIANVIRMQPYLPVYDPTKAGGFRGPQNSFDGADPTNPVEGALIGKTSQKNLKVLGTAFVNVDLTSWLTFHSVFGIDHDNGLREAYTPIYNDGGTLNASLATINNQRGISTSKLFTEQLTAKKDFGKSHVKVDAVYEQQSFNSSNENASGNQGSNIVTTLNGATNVAATSNRGNSLIQSYIGRITYDFDSKYLFSASMRRDGLSIWAPGHKFENFPAVSVGWRIDQENFMKSMKSISEMKLRAGYGTTGINPGNLGNYPYLSNIQGNQTTYPFGNAVSVGNGSFSNGITNPELSWERTEQFNVGLDLGLLMNKITVTAEYYKRNTDNQILQIPTPGSLGFNNAGSNANVAAMQNTGMELQVGYHKTSGDFNWHLTGLVSGTRNKVVRLSAASNSIFAGADADFGGGAPITNTVVGQPVQSYYGYIVEGIFQSAAEVAASPVQNTKPKPTDAQTSAGDLKFKDLNNDNKITDADRTFLGSFIPKFTYSLNYAASYKNLDLSVFFQGVQGNKIFNGTRILLEGMPRLFNAGTAVLNAWTPSNTTTDIPRAVSGDPNLNVRPSTRWIEDGSFLRLKNLSVGYNIPAASLKSITKGSFSKLRLYVSSQNLLTVTKYKGYDPEVGSRNGTLTNGIDYGQYPTARSFQFGLQAGF